jgi:hypothetical protein
MVDRGKGLTPSQCAQATLVGTATTVPPIAGTTSRPTSSGSDTTVGISLIFLILGIVYAFLLETLGEAWNVGQMKASSEHTCKKTRDKEWVSG